MQITITNKLLLDDIPSDFRKVLIDRLTLQNPKWIENARMGRWNRGTPKHLKYYQSGRGGRLFIPRGLMRQVALMCRRRGEPLRIQDRRREAPAAAFDFEGRLKPFQQEAVDVMLTRDFGTLAAPTGSGKTVMALYMIAARRQPTLVIVHTKDLAFQWIERIGQFMGIAPETVGLVGAGKQRLGDRITVGLVQSLYRRAEEIAPHIGHLVVDECHRIPSRTFTDAVTEFDAKFMLGLSATPWRRDGLSKLIFWHVGDAHFEIEKEGLVRRGDVLAADVIVRTTDFKPYFDPVNEYSKMLAELTSDDRRNRLIAEDVAHEVRHSPGICLVVSDRKHHCETLEALLRYGHKVTAAVLTGDRSAAERRRVVEQLERGQVRVVLATGQLIGEGFDCRNLTTLFLATPIRFSGRVLQYLGRVLRPAPGKLRARVYDYVDVHVPPLKAAAQARQRVYRE